MVRAITTTFPVGFSMTIDCVAVHTVDDNGLTTSVRVQWEPDRALAIPSYP